jgi:hypothetical protein
VRFRRGIENPRAFGDDFPADAVTRDQRYVEFFHLEHAAIEDTHLTPALST